MQSVHAAIDESAVSISVCSLSLSNTAYAVTVYRNIVEDVARSIYSSFYGIRIFQTSARSNPLICSLMLRRITLYSICKIGVTMTRK